MQRYVFGRGGGFHRPTDPRTLLHRIALVHDLVFDASEARIYFDEEVSIAREEARGRTVVLSNERLAGDPSSGGYDSKMIADRLPLVFPGAKVLMVIREQASMIVSCWKQYVRVGGPQSLPRYIRGAGGYRVPQFDLDYFEYHRLIAHYQRLFGDDKFLVLPVELLRADPRAFVSSIATFAGAPVTYELPPEPANVGLSAFSSTLKRRANLLLVRDGVNPGAPLRIPRLNKAMIDACRRIDSIAPDRMLAVWDKRLRAYADQVTDGRFAESNRKTAKLTGLDLAGFGYDC